MPPGGQRSHMRLADHYLLVWSEDWAFHEMHCIQEVMLASTVKIHGELKRCELIQ